MASVGDQAVYGSASSSNSVMDAIAAWHRSQYFASSNVPSSSALDDRHDFDQEALVFPYYDDDDDPTCGDHSHRASQSNFEWSTPPQFIHPNGPRRSFSRVPSQEGAPTDNETTPLLHNVSFTSRGIPAVNDGRSSSAAVLGPIEEVEPAPRRRASIASNKNVPFDYGGRSTYGQTLFNATAILLGIGMLSEPLAFACAGWIGGSILIVFYAYITCYTAKLLAHIIIDDPRLRSYADIGRKAFGPRSTLLTSVVFCLELFAVSVVLVTLSADSLHSVWPKYSANTYKICSLVVLLPTLFFPLSILSYTSMLGLVSTLLIIAVIFIDGLSKTEGPGSLWSPAETSFGPGNWTEIGVSFGLLMAGFSGHAVIPSLARDMVDPSQFDHMINWAFIIATFLYAVIGSAGYLMFGRFVHDEISKDLLQTPGYNPVLNEVAMWMLVIAPLTKYAISTRPLNATVEVWLGIDTSHSLPTKDQCPHDGATARQRVIKLVLTVISRIVCVCFSVFVSIMIPEFSSAMAFLGSFSAFMLCVIGPFAAKVALAGRCTFFDASMLATATVMAVWGTVAAFWIA